MKIFANNANVFEDNSIITANKIMRAKDSEADYISADLKLTKDNQFICMSKSRLLPPINARTWTLEEIKAHRQYLLSLQEFLLCVDGVKDINLNINCRNEDIKRYASSLQEALSMKYDFDVMVSSTNINFLENISSELVVSKSLTINGKTTIFDCVTEEDLKNIDAVFLSSEMFDNGRYRYYLDLLNQEQKLYAWIWNLLYRDNPKIFDTIINTGVCDGILTNEVNELARRLAR